MYISDRTTAPASRAGLTEIFNMHLTPICLLAVFTAPIVSLPAPVRRDSIMKRDLIFKG